jgi:hypothetical protein
MTTDPAELARKKRRHRNERIAAAFVVLLAAAITVAVLRSRDRENREIASDTRYVPKREVITPEVRLLAEYVRIDTSTPEGRKASPEARAGWSRNSPRAAYRPS